MSKMNWKAVTIVLATSIPIIIVAIIIFRSKVDINDSSCKANETCVRYCCHHDLICNGVPHNFTNETFGKNLKHPYKLLPGLRCEHEAYLGILEDITFFDNGHIDESGKRIPWKHYCVDKNISEYIFKICFNPNEMELIRETYPYFMTASLPFLIITLLVYGFVKDLRNLHGKCLMAYASSLTIMYVTLIINSFTEDIILNYKIGCMTVGYTFLTSLLCCFFWLNVMCYDIYRAFRVEIKSESNGQFIKFCAYAFGIPIVYMMIVFVLNYYQLIPDEYNNNIGYGSCLISNDFGQDIHQNSIQWIYIYGPILLLISVNIIFYGITAWKFFCVERDRARVCRTSTSRIHHGQCDNSENRIRFLCYLRLSIIMGLPWIIEILSFSINNTWLFAVSIFNCLQGFVVFIIFVWNPRVTKHLKRRYTGLSERNNFLRSRMDLPERNGPIGGSAATLLDGPVIDQSPDNDNYNSNGNVDESSQNSRVLNEMREKIERMS